MKETLFVRLLNGCISILDRCLATALTILVGIMSAGVMLSVFLRYVFGIAFAWSEELLTVVFIATSFFGAALGIREKEHIAISFFEKSGPRAKAFLRVLSMCGIIAVSLLVYQKSLIWIERVGKVPSPATGIPNGVFYLFVPISFAMTIFYCLVDIAGLFLPIDAPRTKSDYADYGVNPSAEVGGKP